MKYSAWIDFTSFSIAISLSKDGYDCIKFVNNSIVRGAVKKCSSKEDLRYYLLGLPSPPKENIEFALASLDPVEL